MKENKLEIQKINKDNQIIYLNGEELSRVIDYSIAKDTKNMATVTLKFDCEQINIKNV